MIEEQNEGEKRWQEQTNQYQKNNMNMKTGKMIAVNNNNDKWHHKNSNK